MPQAKRRRLFVDSSVQGNLVARALGYWLFCLLSVALMSIIWSILIEHPMTSAEVGRRLWQFQAPALFSTVLLLPLVIIDAIRWSHRFVGPLVRIRRAIKQLAHGEPVEPLKFREADYWGEFAEDFNRVAARLAPPSPPRLPLVDALPQEPASTHLTTP